MIIFQVLERSTRDGYSTAKIEILNDQLFDITGIQQISIVKYFYIAGLFNYLACGLFASIINIRSVYSARVQKSIILRLLLLLKSNFLLCRLFFITVQNFISNEGNLIIIAEWNQIIVKKFKKVKKNRVKNGRENLQFLFYAFSEQKFYITRKPNFS